MLWLLRHAEAADELPDDERPLTERGLADAEAAGHALAYLGEQIEVCLSSPKRRALQTAELACEPLGVDVTPEPALAGEPIDIRAVTAGLANVLLVGHDPSLSLLLHDLTGTQSRMKKGGLAGISKGELLVLLRPADLRAIAAASHAVTRG
jgi:phosphohistidine phosphatase